MPSVGINYKEDLTSRIRDLIDGYSKDSILKEYLQNADDSQAKELVVTYDKRIHQSLINLEFEEAAGPALLLYNDSSFKEKDFESIVNISNQGKTGDAGSTGRFGQGFSSSFSISDHPSFISSGFAYWFDVLRQAVSREDNNSIQCWAASDFSEVTQWINTFRLPEKKDVLQGGTLFRLPLRNEETSSKSKISNEIFDFDDFLNWCDEWRDNADNLLFLRHVNRLVLQEVDEEGILKIHLEISTENKDEINSINKSIQKQFTGDLLAICHNWLSHNNELPSFKYHHIFNILFFDRNKESYQNTQEKWAVINGLYRGKNNSLVHQAINVLNIYPNPRKVLPWVGVAKAIDVNNKPLKDKENKLFTFLPLPISSNYPIHIHGWFDLNPKRTEITHDGTGRDKEILIEWNRLLMKDGVGQVWAQLVDFIKDEKHLSSYFSLWAKESNSNSLDENVTLGFYEQIISLKSLFCLYKNQRQWKLPTDGICVFNKLENNNLLNAFKEHYQIITPKPYNYILTYLKNVEVMPDEINSQYIRNKLKEISTNISLPSHISTLLIPMLSRKNWLLEVLSFCAGEECDFSQLGGLPLEITIDQNIHPIGENRIFDESPDLELFQNNQHLFLDKDVTKLIQHLESDRLPASWLQPSFQNKIRVFKDNFDLFDVEMDWVSYCIKFITDEKVDTVAQSQQYINELNLLFKEDNSFSLLASDIHGHSPVMIPEEDINNRHHLESSSMNLVHHDYLAVYKPLLKHKGLITELTAKTLALHLITLDDYEFFKNDEAREYLVTLLASDNFWYNDLESDEREKFSSIPFIKTDSDNLYPLSTSQQLYIPSKFTPPEHIKSIQGEYELISVQSDSQEYYMYKNMGIEEQTVINYLSDVVVPFIKNTTHLDERNLVLKWLAAEWKNIEDWFESYETDFIDMLRHEQIIPCQADLGLHKAKHLYDLNFSDTLPDFMKTKNYLPIVFEGDKSAQKNWLYFLNVMGISKSIIPEHIVDVVDLIIEDNNQSNAISLLNFISNKFEIFERMKFGQGLILNHLKNKEWFPVDITKRILHPSKKYEFLQQPNSLILQDNIKVIGGSFYALSKNVKLGKKDVNGEFKKKEMAELLGVITKLPFNDVLNSFRRLWDIKVNSEHVNKEVLYYAIAFYKYLGRKKLSGIPQDIKQKSIFIKNRWISSEKVFQQKIMLQGTYCWDELIKNSSDEQLEMGLEILGVRKNPDIPFLVNHLINLPISQDLDKFQLNDSKAVLRVLQESPHNENIRSQNTAELPILARNDQLIPHEDLYINDLPAYNNATNKNEELFFCQVQFSTIAKLLNVVSLADNVKEKLNESSSILKSKNEISNELRLDEHIKSDSFKSAILRLNYHEDKVREEELNEEILANILPSKISFADKLVLDYSIDNIWIYTDDEASTFEDSDNDTLFILDQVDADDMCDSISTYICDAGELSRDSFSFIARILRKRMDKEAIDTFLDKKNIKSLPQELHINESIYGEGNLTYPSNESDIHDVDPSHTNEQEAESDDIYKADNDKQTKNSTSSLDQNTSHNTNESTNNKSAEIPPPIMPKSSSRETGVNEFPNEKANNHQFNSESRQANQASSPDLIVSPNERKPVYVSNTNENLMEQKNKQKSDAIAIGNKGEEYILTNYKELLLEVTNFMEKAPINNEGFDLVEKNSTKDIVRYIEVKTLTGQWGKGGVSLTSPQLRFAQSHSNWWLFVVENINTNNTQVYTFKNPVHDANQFMFDNSWKQLAYREKRLAKNIPKIGDVYDIGENDNLYEVLEVKQKGKFYMVVLIGSETLMKIKKKYSTTWKKV